MFVKWIGGELGGGLCLYSLDEPLYQKRSDSELLPIKNAEGQNQCRYRYDIFAEVSHDWSIIIRIVVFA